MACPLKLDCIKLDVLYDIIGNCCKVVSIALCEDNVARLRDRFQSEPEEFMRNSDLSTKEGFLWRKKLRQLKQRSQFHLATHDGRGGFCSFFSFPFDSYIAATLLQTWDKLDDEEPVEPMPSDNTGTQLTRKFTAPVGAIEAELSLFQPQPMGIVVRGSNEGEGSYGSNDSLLLESLGVRGEGDQVAREVLSTMMAGARTTGMAMMESRSIHPRGLTRAKSFEIIHEKLLLVLDRELLVKYHEH